MPYIKISYLQVTKKIQWFFSSISIYNFSEMYLSYLSNNSGCLAKNLWCENALSRFDEWLCCDCWWWLLRGAEPRRRRRVGLRHGVRRGRARRLPRAPSAPRPLAHRALARQDRPARQLQRQGRGNHPSRLTTTLHSSTYDTITLPPWQTCLASSLDFITEAVSEKSRRWKVKKDFFCPCSRPLQDYTALDPRYFSVDDGCVRLRSRSWESNAHFMPIYFNEMDVIVHSILHYRFIFLCNKV